MESRSSIPILLKEENMVHSRREFLATGAAAATFAAVPLATSAAETRDQAAIADELIRSFDSLPGDKALKIYAPAAEGSRRLLVQSNSNKMLFVASATLLYFARRCARQTRPTLSIQSSTRSLCSTTPFGHWVAQRSTRQMLPASSPSEPRLRP